tara:strand:+ start:361 stop:681 length:321 start_codon:yes stop_codon:yes gene_type:complete
MSRIEPFSNNDIVIRMFYVDWCGYCTKAKPGFTEFMNQHNDSQVNGKNVKIEMINCEENDENAQLASEFNVKGYPTIIAVVDGNNHSYDDGDKTASGFGSWMQSIF